MSKRFKGYSINDIIRMEYDEFSSLSKSELRQAVSRLASAANKRVVRLNEVMAVSPAAMEAAESGGKFSTRGKSELELQIEFRRVSNFLTQNTSTVKGARLLEEQTRQDLKAVYGIDISKQDYADLLQGFSQIVNESPDYQSRALRYKYLKNFNIDLANNQMSTTDISNAVTSILNRYYSVGGAQYDGVAEYFGFD